MSTQVAFDRVVQFIRTQGAPAGQPGHCMLFDLETDRKCAVGCLIKDEHYHIGLEGMPVPNCQNSDELRDVIAMSNPDMTFDDQTWDMLTDMQIAHDTAADQPPEDFLASFEENARRVAGKYGLEHVT